MSVSGGNVAAASARRVPSFQSPGSANNSNNPSTSHPHHHLPSTLNGRSSPNRSLLVYALIVGSMVVLQVSRQIPLTEYHFDPTVATLPLTPMTAWKDGPTHVVPGEMMTPRPPPTTTRADGETNRVDPNEDDTLIQLDLWKELIESVGVRSVLDVGCGRGIRSLWFQYQGITVTCVSMRTRSDRILQSTSTSDSAIPVIEHDYKKAPWAPSETFGACWMGFREMGEDWIGHVLPTLQKCALLVMPDSSWDTKLKAWGWQSTHRERIWSNPTVASLPQYIHLFPNCAHPSNCEDPRVRPLEINNVGHNKWKDKLRKNNIPLEHLLPTEDPNGVTIPDPTNADTASDPNQHPLLKWRRGEISLQDVGVLPVVVWPLFEHGIGNAEALHIEQNGISESKHLRLAKLHLNNTEPNVIWVGDTGYAYGWNLWCGEYLKRIKLAQDERRSRNLSTQWPVFIVDFTDGATFQRCPQIETWMGKEFVFYSTRSIVQGRSYVNSTGWVRTGSLMSLTMKDGLVYKHTPLVVRTDTIRSLRDVLQEKYNMGLDGPVERIERAVDVSHFWPTNGLNVGTVESQLRHQISVRVERMGREDNVTVFVGLAGEAVRTGRRGVMSAYIEALLNSKIVVVAQRDSWEDHYRLFEGLVSGAMIITDQMLSLPVDLKNGTSIIEVTSADDLRNKILYYLSHPEERIAIAQQGRLVAMRRHRAWHRIEEIVFGLPVSECTGKICPFIVEASDARRRRR